MTAPQAADLTPENLADLRALAEQHMDTRDKDAHWLGVGLSEALDHIEQLTAQITELRRLNDRHARNLAGYGPNASGYTVAEVDAVENEVDQLRATVGMVGVLTDRAFANADGPSAWVSASQLRAVLDGEEVE